MIILREHLTAVQRAGRCTGCGRNRDDLRRGRPAWPLPGRWTGVGFCTDCRDYLDRTYSTDTEPGWTPEPAGNDFRGELLEALCPVPSEADAVRCESQWLRFSHADLSRLKPAELAAEERRVELRAVLDPDPDDWLGESLKAIREERKRRGR